MSNTSCVVCKVVGILVAIGAINWGLVGVAQFNLVESILGTGTGITRIVYVIVGLSGILSLGGLLGLCPCSKKK